MQSTDKTQSQDQSRQSRRAKRTRANQATRSVAQAIAAPVAAVVAGAAILVGGYMAVVNEQAALEPPPPVVATVDWDWSDDYGAVVVELADGEGVLIAEIPATVSVTESAPTCTAQGTKTYRATAVYEDTEYTDTRAISLPATGHSFDEGKATIDPESGAPTTVYECTECHEQVVITTSIEENEN